MKNFETKIEDIFGIVDDAIDNIERTRQPKKNPLKHKRPSALPRMKIKRSQVPDELVRSNPGNVVYVPETVLKGMTSALNINTKKLNTLLIRRLMPLLLSYQTSTTYTSAAIKEGLDVDINFDPGLADCIKHLGYLNVVMFFVKNSQLPMSVKKRFMRRFSDLIAEQAVSNMVDENKAEFKRTQMQELQAVVYSRQKNKAELKTPDQKDTKKPEQKSVGVKRSRNS